MRCPACGFEGPEGAKFCAGCGAGLPMLCEACGSALVPGGRFCPNCGHPAGPGGDSSTGRGDTEKPGVDAEGPGVGGEGPGVGGEGPGVGGEGPGVGGAVQNHVAGGEVPDRAAAGGASAGTVRHSASGMSAPGERRLVTILFADLVGSTSLGEDVDPEDLAELVNRAFEVMTRAVADSGGHIGRLMGDGMLAFFGAPVSHEDDPLRAVRAGLAIVRGVHGMRGDGAPDSLDVRVGIDSGMVVVGRVGSDLFSEYTTMGDAANTAARLQSAAEPGNILLSATTARLIRGAVEIEDAGPLQLKGKSEPVAAFRVVGGPPALGASTRGLTGISTPIVGRDSERAQLIEAFDDAVASGAGSWITVVGEAGVGKTRLLTAFLDDLVDGERRANLLHGRAVAQESGRAYALLRDILVRRYGGDDADQASLQTQLEAGLVNDLEAFPGIAERRAARDLARLVAPDVDRALDPREGADRALGAFEALLRSLATSSPLVVVLEDLHWADDASLDAVPRLVSALAGSPALVVGNSRPTLFARRPLWGEGELQHLRMDLQPLGASSAQTLVAALLETDKPPPELVRFIRDRSEGNAYFIEELVDMLQHRGLLRRQGETWLFDAEELGEGAIPTTLQGVLQARLDSVSAEERGALQRAAVVGRVFWDGAVQALGAETAILDGLRARGLVYARERTAFPGQREFLFRHALLADAAYETLLKRERPGLHGLVADWLLERVGGRYAEFAARIGEHCERAVRLPEAAKHYGAAADAALATYANSSAVSYYTRALELAPEASPEDRFALHRGRELALDAIGNRDAQSDDLDEMRGLADQLDAASKSYVRFRMSWLADRTGNYEAARLSAEEALKLAGRHRVSRANALVNLGNALLSLDEFEQALEAFRESRRIQEKLGDERGTAKCLLGEASALERLGQTEDAQSGLAEALDIFERVDDLRFQAICHTNWGVLLAVEDLVNEAEPHFAASLELYRSAGDRAGEAKALTNVALVAKHRGNLEVAEARLREALELSRAVSNRDHEADIRRDLAEILADVGRETEAEAHLAAAARLRVPAG